MSAPAGLGPADFKHGVYIRPAARVPWDHARTEPMESLPMPCLSIAKLANWVRMVHGASTRAEVVMIMFSRARSALSAAILLATACSPSPAENRSQEAALDPPQTQSSGEPPMINVGDDADTPDNPAPPEPAPGRSSGPRVDLPGGLSLFPPPGWAAQGSDGNRTALVGPDGQSLVIASLDDGMLQQAVAELGGSIDLGDGIVLDPLGVPSVKGGIHTNRYSVRGAPSPTLGSIMIREVSPGRTLTLIALVPSAGSDAVQATLNQLMTTFEIGAARPQAASDWERQLRGRYLVKFYSGNGYSEKHELWLCSNGSFVKRVDGGGFTAGVASGAFEGGLAGTWRVQGPLSGTGELILSTSDGDSLRYTLRQASDGVLIDGERWLRGENNQCS